MCLCRFEVRLAGGCGISWGPCFANARKSCRPLMQCSACERPCEKGSCSQPSSRIATDKTWAEQGMHGGTSYAYAGHDAKNLHAAAPFLRCGAMRASRCHRLFLHSEHACAAWLSLSGSFTVNPQGGLPCRQCVRVQAHAQARWPLLFRKSGRLRTDHFT